MGPGVSGCVFRVTGVVESVGGLLGIVPFGGKYRWVQVLLSFAPYAAAALVLIVAGLATRKIVPWRRALAFLRRNVRWVAPGVLALLAAGGLAVARWHGGHRPAGVPAASRPAEASAAAAPWVTFMGNCARTGSADAAAGPTMAKTIWTFQDGLSRAPFAASPALAGGRVYVGSDNRRLYCLDADTGKPIWTFTAAHELFASPVVADGRVFLGEGLHHTSDARCYCLDAADGRKLWEFQTTGHVEFSPTLVGERLYLAAGGDGVYCLDARTGRKLWQHAGVHVDMSPLLTDEGVFVGTVYGEPAFFRLDPRTGREIWKTPAPYGVCGSGSTDGRRLYFGLGNGTFGMSHAQPVGSVHCLACEDGRVLWRTTQVADAVLTAVAVRSGRVYFGSRDGRLYCADARTGRIHWSHETGSPVLSSPAVLAGRVYFGCDDGLLYCLDALTGRRLWTYDVSAVSFSTDVQIVASPAVGEGRVYFGSMNFHFFCIGDR